MNDFGRAYNILIEIFKGKAYSNLSLSRVIPEADNAGLVTKMLYGTLDNHFKYDYFIKTLTDKKPVTSVAVLLELAMYCISNVSSMPSYAVVNEAVEIVKNIGKKQLSGFVNAFLRNYNPEEIALPKNEFERLSVQYSKPLWLIKALRKQYKAELTEKILSVKPFKREHLRRNTLKISKEKFEALLKTKKVDFEISEVGGYFVDYSKTVGDLCAVGYATMQSVCSILCAKALGNVSGEVLDLCSAPGGKAVFIAENFPESKVTACDLHKNRLLLIDSYKERMGCQNIVTMQNDGAKLRKDFVEKFDYVLCDAPCSGLGVMGKKPDILIDSSLEKCQSLAEIQYSLLNNACNYAKAGGVVVYSTCTILREENYNVVGKLLKERKDVVLEKIENIDDNEGFVQILQDEKGRDGFFIARLKKI